MTEQEYALGRHYSPDERDERFPMTAELPAAASSRTYRYHWANGWWGDQGIRPWCVAYSWRHWVEDGPVTAPGDPTFEQLRDAYGWMQNNDEWSGTNYDGTSVRAGAKFWLAQGKIRAYTWAFELDPVIQAILEVGPVVFGTTWYRSMFSPDEQGIVDVGGSTAGGHAYLLNGVNTRTQLFRFKNSWGRDWGRDGHGYLRFADAERLLRDRGEACLPVAA